MQQCYQLIILWFALEKTGKVKKQNIFFHPSLLDLCVKSLCELEQKCQLFNQAFKIPP